MPGSQDHPSPAGGASDPGPPGARPITQLIRRAGGGDADATQRLLPVVYAELRRLAQSYLAGERPDHTLTATALVHEAYLKLADGSALPGERGAFFAVAAKAMRHILVDHARARKAQKRGGGGTRIPLDDAVAWFEERSIDLADLDSAMIRLAEYDPRKARLVELRFFAGMSVEQAARAMDIPLRTAERDWTHARAWLRNALCRPGGPAMTAPGEAL